jgi:hypothetical protein
MCKSEPQGALANTKVFAKLSLLDLQFSHIHHTILFGQVIIWALPSDALVTHATNLKHNKKTWCVDGCKYKEKNRGISG